MKEYNIIAKDSDSINANNSFNITGLPWLGKLIRNRWLMRLIHTFSIGLLVLAIYLGLFTEDKRTGLTVLLFWGIFGPLFTCITVAGFGAVFCSVCPHGAIGKWLKKFSLKKRFPRSLRGAWISIMVMMLGYWLFAFSMPGFIGASSWNTAWYFLVFSAIAIGFFLIYDDMAYCKYVCPLGRVITTHGKLGGLSIKSNQDDCVTCTDFSCAKACPYHLSPFNFEKNNNTESCTLCMECVYDCSSIELHWHTPGKAITQPVKRNDPHDYWVFLTIFAVAAVGIQFLHGLQHTSLSPYLPWNIAGEWLNQWFGISVKSFKFSGLISLATALITTITLALWSVLRATQVSPISNKQARLDAAYALAPVAILGLIPHSIIMFATHYYHHLVYEIGALFGASWKVAALASRGDAWLQWLNVLPWFGVAWGISILWKRSAHWSFEKSTRLKVVALLASPIWYYLLIMLIKVAARTWLPMPAHP